jgi:hypothetical protein
MRARTLVAEPAYPYLMNDAVSLGDAVLDVQRAAAERVVRLPRLVQELTLIERHVLGRVAVHSWTHDGSIPFVAPTAHQFAIGLALAAPGVRLLEVVVSPISFQQSFRLTHLGAYVVRRLFRLVPAHEDQRRELAFTKMRQMMCNAWETHD